MRVDGRGFTQFTSLHGFEKPNNKKGLDLMDRAAVEVMKEFPDARLAYGTSDEYSFVLPPSTNMFDRRSSKVVSVLTSCFAANYVRWWPEVMGPSRPLKATPVFDGRAVCYPNAKTLRDYLSWRQADCHVNNQYNTPFWLLVQQGGMKPPEAQAALAGTDAAFKNELMFSRFGVNYNSLPEQFKKGSVVVRAREPVVEAAASDGRPVERVRPVVKVLHCDIIGQEFWDEHGPRIL